MTNVRSKIHSRPVITVPTVLALAVLLGGPFAGETAAQPSIRFVSELHSAVEAHADLSIPMILSEPAPYFLEIEIQQIPVTATPDMDYIGGSIWAYVQPGESTAVASPHLFGDMDPEPPEEFRLEILDDGGAYSVGSVGTCRVTIIDDDSESLSAHFEIDEDVPLTSDGRITLLVADDVTVEVDMVVDDLPPGGGDVYWLDSRLPGVQTMSFVDDPRQTIELTSETLPPGGDPVVVELSILDPAGGKATEGGDVTTGFVERTSGEHFFYCFWCLFAYYTAYLSPADCEDVADDCLGFDCPDKSVGETIGEPAPGASAADLSIFRRYRDEVLAASPVGAYYVGLYETYSAQIMEAILSEPALFHRVAEASELWRPAVTAQVDGAGAGFVITADMQAALLGLMDKLETHGSPELADLVADFRVELDLENVAGTTAADLQEEIESNPMETEQATWGEIKSMYKEKR